MSHDVIVTIQHLRTMPSWTKRTGLCARGARRWFAAHGLDWSQFVSQGLPSSVFAATGDALALRLVAHARAVESARG